MKRFMLIGLLLLICSLSVYSQYSITETKLLFTATNPTTSSDDTTGYFDVGKYITWGILAVAESPTSANDTIAVGLQFLGKNTITGKTTAAVFLDTLDTRSTAVDDYEFFPIKSTTVDKIPGYNEVRIGRDYTLCGTIAGRTLKLYLVGTRIAKYPSGN
jgi:hypothetical protein